MREQMFSAMFEHVMDGQSGVLFDAERKQPEQQEQRIWEIDSDEEEKEEKKRAKNKRKYLRKKEKAQAEKAELQSQKSESKDTVSQGLAAMSIKDTPTVSTDERESSSDVTNTVPSTQPKLSKRQKKTLLKKTKQAQAAVSTPELSRSSSINDTASESSHAKSKITRDNESEKENKSNSKSSIHQKQNSECEGREDEVATESEVEAVMETIAKRFGQ
jgi:hypothetical protein